MFAELKQSVKTDNLKMSAVVSAISIVVSFCNKYIFLKTSIPLFTTILNNTNFNDSGKPFKLDRMALCDKCRKNHQN